MHDVIRDVNYSAWPLSCDTGQSSLLDDALDGRLFFFSFSITSDF